MAVYTNVRMKADSPEGQWWQHQTDRDYAMQVLVQLANQRYGKNVDLKSFSLEKMIDQEPTHQPQAPTSSAPSQTTTPQVTEPEPKHQETKIEIPKPLQQPTEPEAISAPADMPRPTVRIQSEETAETHPDLNNALFGDDSDDNEEPPAPQPKNGSFRDKL